MLSYAHRTRTRAISETSFTRKRGAALRFDDDTGARIEAVSDAELVAGANTDLDNPPVEPARVHRMEMAREVRRIRETTCLSQPQFSARYRIRLARLREL